MKISHKMVLVFSLLAVLTSVANMLILFDTQQNMLNSTFVTRYRDTGERIISELEQHIELMDMALEELIADIEFMTAFYRAYTDIEADEMCNILYSQNIMSRRMYRSPLLSSFHRVAVFTDSGFFLPNSLEKTSTVVSQSDDAFAVIDSIPWLETVRSHPTKRQLIGVHLDEWTTGEPEMVFSVAKAAVWYGELIGYIEISEPYTMLESIFTFDNRSDLFVQGIMKDGRILFCQDNDTAVYENIPLETIATITTPGGTERTVLRLESEKLGLDVYISQDLSAYHQQYWASVGFYLMVEMVVLLVILTVVVFASLSMSRSIRSLTKRVSHLPVDNLLSQANTEVFTTMVTRPSDKEIRELERVINKLMRKLNSSLRNEIALRESTVRAQLNALQTQINPHFIYNSLNIISAKGMEADGEGISIVCSELSRMLRYATDTQSQVATLGSEIQNVRSYLTVVKARYEDALVYDVNIPEELHHLLLPKLTLQPLVENAIVHGDNSEGNVQRVSVTCHIRDGVLHLLIRDNGAGFDPANLIRLQRAIQRIESGQDNSSTAFDGGHIGLLNTCLRIHHYSKGKMHMHLRNDHGAIVELTIPCITVSR